MSIKNRVLLYTVVAVATLIGCVSYAFGQTPALPDQLGLQAQSQAADNKIPVVVGAAVEASRLQAAYGFYFGGSNSLYTTNMGAEIQSMVSDSLLDLGYSPVAPKTGYQKVQRASIRGEFSPDNGRRHELTRTAQFVVIPQISFVTNRGTKRTVNLGPIISYGTSKIGRDAGQIVRSTVGGARTVQVGQAVEAILTLRFYDSTGQEIRAYTASERMDWEAYKEFRAVITTAQSINNPTLLPLARKLVTAVTEQMGRS